ncbi:putative ABC transport system permease protein [Scopulibacillus darangshiensis]|uniref:Putative ABC transport system permease protein n=1 Tax=Scopulibacillus darangshiensis TaxID=442528 RepID=A0A4R2NI24_9BACL|nr:ABC transporter permease [Scopulibacillus darangshiensis]TCP20980.1 putative ABC transport system permease protein [Scopulibacillus darangshiensis]
MFASLFGAVESGIIYAIMALGVYLSFRILDFPDLTVDGSFVTGAGTAAILIVHGQNPFLATIAGGLAGFIAGCITGILHTKGKINPLLSGILMMIALYSVNLRIMDQKPNVPLLGQETSFSMMTSFWQKLGLDAPFNSFLEMVGLGDSLPKTWGIFFFMIIVVILIKLITDWFLKTEVGLAIRAVGDNKRMIRSLSANTDRLTVLGLGISNALVAFSGALIAQYGAFADVGMGIGMIIIGLASVIIGEALFGTKSIARATLAVILGAIIYRVILAIALRIEFLDTGDMKLITAVIVIFSLVLPKVIEANKEKRRRAKKRQAWQKAVKGEGDDIAST